MLQKIAVCPDCGKSNLSIYLPNSDMIAAKDSGRNSFYCSNCGKVVIVIWKVVEI